MASFDNPDYLHLKSLSDMLKQTILWATAADAQVQILLAKRGPVLVSIPAGAVCPPDLKPPDNPVIVASNPPAIKKAEIRTVAANLGIPAWLLDQPDYLNGKHKPSGSGIAKTLDLIGKVRGKVLAGEDPSELWVSNEH